MQVERTPLEGLLIITPDVYGDQRGFFFESYNQAKFRELGIELEFIQDNHAMSVKNTVRGLHFQAGVGQAKLVRCVRGRLWDVVVDIRPESPTLGQWFAVELSEENRKMFFIPVGFAHGYAVLSDQAECLYKCTNLYDAKLETGIRWNDETIGVDWPVENPILSERDQMAQSFEEYLDKVRAGALV